jgi:hypothetical protein
MKRTHKIAVATLLSAGLLLIAMPFKIHAGKSIRFFLNSGFRAPFDAEIIESGRRCVGRDGEWIYVFATDDQTTRNYLSKTPWRNCEWQKGPVPDNAVWVTGEIRPYLRYLSNDGVWYMYQVPIRPRHDEGRLMIIDAPAKRIFFSFWWW